MYRGMVNLLNSLSSTLTFCLLFVQRVILHINKGDHGFSNEEMDMKMIFRAFGPDFRDNFLAEPFDSVSIYPLMCKLLGVVPEANNGSLSHTKDMLVDKSDTGKHLNGFSEGVSFKNGLFHQSNRLF